VPSQEDNSTMPMSPKEQPAKPKSSKHKYNIADRKLVTAIKKLYKGLDNPLNNCWFNAAVASYNHLFGSYQILNDSDMSNDLLKIFKSVNISARSDTLSSEDLTVLLNNLFSRTSIEIGQHQDPMQFILNTVSSLDCLYQNQVISIVQKTTCMKCNNSFDVEISEFV